MLHYPRDLALLFAAPDVVALVVLVLPLGQAEEDLGEAVLEVHLERDQGDPLGGQGLTQLLELLLVEEELAVTERVVVEDVAVIVLVDVDVHQPQLAVVELGVAVLELDPAGTDRLDLGPG